MPRLLNDPEHWHLCAQEARVLAKQLDDSEARSAALEIAYQYERIANRAKQLKQDHAHGRTAETNGAALD
jgi:hypothetical protein